MKFAKIKFKLTLFKKIVNIRYYKNRKLIDFNNQIKLKIINYKLNQQCKARKTKRVSTNGIKKMDNHKKIIKMQNYQTERSSL